MTERLEQVIGGVDVSAANARASQSAVLSWNGAATEAGRLPVLSTDGGG